MDPVENSGNQSIQMTLSQILEGMWYMVDIQMLVV